MEIALTPEQEAELEALAGRQGKRVAEVAGEAIATWLDYQGWAAEATREIEEGWRQAQDPSA